LDLAALGYGTGANETTAAARALFEALERSAISYDGQGLTLTCFASLGAIAIHPNAHLLLSDSQLNGRVLLDPETEIAWVPATSLSGDGERMFPASLCFRDLPRNSDAGWIADSNGVAAGSVIEEAIFNAILEIVERDAVSIWWFNRVRRPAYDLARFSNASIAEIIEFHERHRRRIWVLDVTTDLDIPVAVAVSAARHHAPGRTSFGFGCHPIVEVAVLKALEELCLTVPALTAQAQQVTADQMGCHADLGFLAPAGRSERHGAEPLESVAELVNRAARSGLQTYAIDLTRADIEFPVVRVVMPGMRDLEPRFGRGRLFDVPARMRWEYPALREQDMSPIRLANTV
jgi:ribosomal protein S12 methylthiotransferase accessory factor